jgi:putative intracellular protease/amidase
MEEEVSGACFSEGNVVVDGNLITSRGPGTAGEFALALVSALVGEEAAAKLASGALLK